MYFKQDQFQSFQPVSDLESLKRINQTGSSHVTIAKLTAALG